MALNERKQAKGKKESVSDGLETADLWAGHLLFVGHSPLWGCSLLTPRGRPKSLAVPSAPIYEMTSTYEPKVVLYFHGFSRFWLVDFDLGMASADLFFKPLTRVVVSVAKQDGAGRNLADEV
jgi:hypothetical protein